MKNKQTAPLYPHTQSHISSIYTIYTIKTEVITMTPMANILGCCVVTLLSNNCTLHPFLMADRAKSFIETLFLLLPEFQKSLSAITVCNGINRCRLEAKKYKTNFQVHSFGKWLFLCHYLPEFVDCKLPRLNLQMKSAIHRKNYRK